MPRYYVEKNGEWNIFSSIVDDFILDEFVCLDALKARLLYERYKELTEDIDSLLTDRPRVNVMPYSEAMERIRKTEPTISKMEQVEDEPQTHTVDLGNGFSITANDCDTCKHRDKPFDDLPCDMCCKAHSGYEPKDEPQTGRSE